ncbi:MAG TPA: hypothetical protein PLL69_00595 [Gemmatimonadales bacterium]|nr:hypothetical protein [Gemmatimonadales bacterium]
MSPRTLGRRGAWLLTLLVPVVAAGQAVEATGVLNAVWGDPTDRISAPRLAWTLTDPVSGVARRIELTAGQVETAGGIRALDGRLMQVSGLPAGAARGNREAVPIRAGSLRRAGSPAELMSAPPQLGSKPVALIMCKFSDVASEPTTVGEMQQLFSNSFPNLDHYYRELSAGQMNLSGSNAFGWFVLPNPRSHYVSSGADLTALASDCTAAADAAVDFSGYWGIAFQFNADLDGFAWGGSRFLTLDGTSRSWPMIWMPLWATQTSKHGGYAHELGHALGWSHSSGPYGNSYDSEWDVMSDSYLFHNPGTGTFLPGHTIMVNKEAAAWIPVGRTFTVGAGEQVTFTLEQAEFPAAGSNPLLAWVTIPGSTQRYSLEARRLLGYDQHLPGEAVIIHRVTSGNVATVIDPDNNGDPNDAGAMWVSGETFNSPEGIEVAIGARTAQGWEISVTMPGTIVLRRLNIAADGPGSGTVNSNPAGIDCAIDAGATTGTCSADFEDGTTVILSATATTGSFAGWSGACSGGSCAVLMDRTRTATARFHLEQRVLTVNLSGNGGGTVISSPAGIDCRLAAGTISGTCSAEFGLGESVMLYQASTAGTFGGWTGACSGVTPCPVTLGENRTVGASFNLSSNRLVVAGSGNGSGTVVSSPGGINCIITAGEHAGTCEADFTTGLVVSLTAQATGGDFAGWSGACNGSGQCQVTMNGARAVSAVFELPARQLVVGGGGSGAGRVVSSPAGIDCSIAAGVASGACSAPFEDGALVLLTATATSGSFSGWSEACTGTAPCQVVMTEARAVTAGFELPIHQLVLGINGTGGGTVTSIPAGLDCSRANGSTTGSCTAGFAAGSLVTLSAVAGSGLFVGWSGKCSGSGACRVTMTEPGAVSAEFAAGQEIIDLLVRAMMAGAAVPERWRVPIDQAGNHNGTIDVGDLAAMVHRTPGAVLSPATLRLLVESGAQQ